MAAGDSIKQMLRTARKKRDVVSSVVTSTPRKQKEEKISPALLSERAETLESARDALKAAFVGADSTIDSLINAVKLWWMAPELLQRPVIVNVYGMTGVGKTDIVRALTRHLRMQHRLIEFDMNNSSDHSHNNTVAEALDVMDLNDGLPGVLLFDEMQRFGTVGAMGADVKDTKLSDFWELLSDGKIPQRSRERIQNTMDRITGYMDDDDIEATMASAGDGKRRLGKKLASHLVRPVHAILKRTKTKEQVAGMTIADAIVCLQEERACPEAHEPADYSKLLIILAGNLDDAFHGASQIAEADVDADVFKSNVELVTVVDVKQALANRFKPEQVSRFGNTFVICGTLGRADFTKLIRRELDRSCAKISEICDVAVNYSDDFVDFVYRNGVYPAQGVRPVFTTVATVFDTTVIPVVVDAERDHPTKSVFITYDAAGREIVVTALGRGGKELAVYRVKYHGQLDAIRDKIDPDSVASTAAHEAGHAVVTMALTGVAPLQLLAKTGEGSGNGFSLSHVVTGTKKSLQDRIAVFLAGAAAEELVYGSDLVGTGHGNDLERATTVAAAYARSLGFGGLTANYAMDDHAQIMDNSQTDAVIEGMIRAQRRRAVKILKKHKALLLDIAVSLLDKGKLTDIELVKMATLRKLPATALPQSAVITAGYADVLRKQAKAVAKPTISKKKQVKRKK